eukprot:2158915-Alexandrium_andersonii.AAC.1
MRQRESALHPHDAAPHMYERPRACRSGAMPHTSVQSTNCFARGPQGHAERPAAQRGPRDSPRARLPSERGGPTGGARRPPLGSAGEAGGPGG